MTSTMPMTPPPPPPAMSPMGMMPERRPTGVTILAILDFIGVGIFALFGILAFALGGVFADYIQKTAGSSLGAGFAAAIGALVGIAFLVGAAISLVFGLGYWKGWTWTWYVSGILWILAALNSLFSIRSSVLGAIVGLAIYGFLLWYISQKGVQRWFKVSMNLPWAK